MNETVEERLKRITDYVAMCTVPNPPLYGDDLNWLIARAELATVQAAYIDGHALGGESVTVYTDQIKDENKRLREEVEQL